VGNPGLTFAAKFFSNQPLGGSFLSSAAGLWDPHGSSRDTRRQGRLVWGVTLSRGGPIIQISLPASLFAGGDKAECGGEGAGGRKGRGQEAASWEQDGGHRTHGERPWKAGRSPERASSRPEDGDPFPSAFSPATPLPRVT